MEEALEKRIESYFERNEKLSKHKLVESIKNDFPNWSDNTVNMYLSKLKKQGIINSPSRGIYEFESKILFQPKISSELKKIFYKTKREFPLVTFCIWDSTWFNDFMSKQQIKHYIVLEVEKNAFELVFEFISETIQPVFLNPTEEIFDLYIHNLNEALIVKKIISEAPLKKDQNIIIPTLEKLLVDMLIDTELFSAQQNEKEMIMRSVMEKFTLNESKMRRYAIRRNREKEIEKLKNLSLLK